MIDIAEAHVVEVTSEAHGVVRAKVEIDGDTRAAISYLELTGALEAGDRVLVNTTAVELSLGTGGVHFVVWNLSRRGHRLAGPGHIMKLRYTPFQMAVLAAEEQDSPHHADLAAVSDVHGLPVVSLGLHSQLAAAAAAVKHKDPEVRLVYVMTDGSSLPMALSDLVDALKQKCLLDATVTAGQAFGGDFDAVNVYSALAVAKVAAGCDICLVGPGPGAVGTGTVLGHSGLEQGQVVNAVNSLGGTAIVAPRISFTDDRERHRGISHHTLSALGVAALSPAIVAVPEMDGGSDALIERQLRESGVSERHTIEKVDSAIVIDAMEKFGFGGVKTMGRTPAQDPEFFMAAGAAGLVALSRLRTDG